jgi:hypothetical protein
VNPQSDAPWQRWTLAAAIGLGASPMAVAADHMISAQVSRFDCKSFKPATHSTLASGTRDTLVISNCNGTPSNPIVIRNDPDGNGPTVNTAYDWVKRRISAQLHELHRCRN